MTVLLEELEHKLQYAHERGDNLALVDLYTRLADIHESNREIDAACFFLTHAYVYALESASDAQASLLQRLRTYQREE